MSGTGHKDQYFHYITSGEVDLPWREAQSDGPKGVEIPPPCADGRGPHPRRPRPRCFILPYQVCGCRIHMPRLQTMLTV